MRKSSEKKFRNMMKYYGYYWYKYGDVNYCPHCHKPLPKSEMKPDFVVSPNVTWVECKNNNKSGLWNWTEIDEGGDRSFQREFLIENNGWLFIELGTGNAPTNKGAWLVPIDYWIYVVEPKLKKSGQKSLRYKTVYNKDGSKRNGHTGADILLKEYALEWTAHVGWTIPNNHQWWKGEGNAKKYK